MTDIVERLKEYAEDDHERGCQGRYYDCSCGYDGKRAPLLNEAADEIERLKVENIQMKAALGYAICADDERHIIPENPFKCGICDANKGIHAEVERLRAALREIESITVHSGGDIHGVQPSFWEVAFKQAQDIARAALKEDGDGE